MISLKSNLNISINIVLRIQIIALYIIFLKNCSKLLQIKIHNEALFNQYWICLGILGLLLLDVHTRLPRDICTLLREVLFIFINLRFISDLKKSTVLTLLEVVEVPGSIIHLEGVFVVVQNNFINSYWFHLGLSILKLSWRAV